MDSKSLSPEALAVIDGYLRFTVGAAVCSVPYFNNKTVRSRGALSALVGKGTPKEVFDEAETLAFKNRVNLATFTGDALKKLMADYNIGIDCSALAYHALDAESQAQKRGPLKKHLAFIKAYGLIGSFMTRMHPAKNTDVETFASDENSRTVELHEAAPGDMITMIDGSDTGERNHILIIHKIGYAESIPATLYYSHAVAYPEDGLYGSGIKQGTIGITAFGEPITAQTWTEDGKTGSENRIFARAQRSKTQLRRLKWL